LYVIGIKTYNYSKNDIEENYFWMFYALYCKLLKFGIYKHLRTKLINHLFVKLIILHKPSLNASYFPKWYQNDII
jgi:hypothetical protein